jgi:hypothetical protein
MDIPEDGDPWKKKEQTSDAVKKRFGLPVLYFSFLLSIPVWTIDRIVSGFYTYPEPISR